MTSWTRLQDPLASVYSSLCSRSPAAGLIRCYRRCMGLPSWLTGAPDARSLPACIAPAVKCEVYKHYPALFLNDTARGATSYVRCTCDSFNSLVTTTLGKRQMYGRLTDPQRMHTQGSRRIRVGRHEIDRNICR